VTVIGLDFGERRIGVAVSDPGGQIARPLLVIERSSLRDDMARIAELARSRRAQKVIVGLPLNLDGSAGPAARRARRFASALGRELDLPIALWDERLTTVEAERALLASDRSRQRRKEVRDAVAASLILQSYLDAHRENSPT
jgi:putative Holliday junction resolvase